MNNVITSISSPSHPIGLTLGCHQRELADDYEPSKAFVYLATPSMLDQDIVIVIQTTNNTYKSMSRKSGYTRNVQIQHTIQMSESGSPSKDCPIKYKTKNREMSV